MKTKRVSMVFYNIFRCTKMTGVAEWAEWRALRQKVGGVRISQDFPWWKWPIIRGSVPSLVSAPNCQKSCRLERAEISWASRNPLREQNSIPRAEARCARAGFHCTSRVNLWEYARRSLAATCTPLGCWICAWVLLSCQLKVHFCACEIT